MFKKKPRTPCSTCGLVKSDPTVLCDECWSRDWREGWKNVAVLGAIMSLLALYKFFWGG